VFDVPVADASQTIKTIQRAMLAIEAKKYGNILPEIPTPFHIKPNQTKLEIEDSRLLPHSS
jgi:hypothetical protein